MDCHSTLRHFGLSDVEASAALHYIADHIAGHLAPPEKSLLIFQQAYRCAIRDACDHIRRDAGDTDVATVQHFPTPHTAA